MSEKFVFVYSQDYARTVTTNFQTFLQNDLYIDLIFVCRNNKKVGAHQVVFGCLSKFFYSIFVDNVNTSKEKVLHIHVPDIRAKIMRYILQFIYSGEAKLNREELEEFNENIKLLGMPLDLFTSPETIRNNETFTTANSSKKPVPDVQDTVDLTVTGTNDDVLGAGENSTNHTKSSNPEIRAEATVPATVPSTSNANTSDNPTPPIIDKNPTDNNHSAKNTEAENQTSLTSSSNSSVATKRKLPRLNDPRKQPSSTNLSGSSTTSTVPENRSKIAKTETTEPQVRENNVKKILNGDRTAQERKEAPPPSKRGKYITASIDLDASDDDDDVITLS